MDEDSKDGLDNNEALTCGTGRNAKQAGLDAKASKLIISTGISNDCIVNIEPPCNIIFCDERREVGRLTFSDNQVHFTGNADEAAKLFLESLKPLCDDYIKEKLKKEGK